MSVKTLKYPLTIILKVPLKKVKETILKDKHYNNWH